jgi:hypothetical protein
MRLDLAHGGKQQRIECDARAKAKQDHTRDNIDQDIPIHRSPRKERQPSATSIPISPMLEPTQESPKSNPERTLSRQRRRKCCLSGVNS